MPARATVALRGIAAAMAALQLTCVAIASPQEGVENAAEEARTLTAPATAGRDLLIVPIPLSNPALGTGLTLTAMMFYNPNSAPNPWISGVGASYTSTDTWAVFGFHSMSLAQDRFRALVIAGYSDANLKFYGIGSGAGDRDAFVRIDDRGAIVLIDGMARTVGDLFVGAHYQLLDVDTSIEVPHPNFPDLTIPDIELHSTVSAIGPSLTYDSRNSTINPVSGIYATAFWTFNLSELGSDFSHDKFEASANLYHPIGEATVLAARAAVCGVSAGGPYYDLCSYGKSGDLRGYEAGRYRDRATWAVQIEARRHLSGRFGAVAFAGIGGVADNLGDLGDSKILPSYGLGLRFQASRETNMNLRLDYARGRDSDAIYFGVGEAF